MKKVMITIENSMMVDGDKPDVTEVITEGSLEMTGTGCVLSYDLDPVDDDEPDPESHTDMILDGNTFNFIRTGMYGADFLVEPGVRNQTLYRMPFGNMTVGVHGRELRSDISEDKGSIMAKYEIDFNVALVADYQMDISYRTI
ncbi:MAG: DUF1934 domain-containing protein [Oscillospiraceae bacterium]|nr:DUF1934 domain-containing protein [Oscillospiraceae bacterium]